MRPSTAATTLLHQIWEGFRQAQSENDTLEALQGVGGALALRAEELLHHVLDERGRGLVRRAFEEMVQLGEGALTRAGVSGSVTWNLRAK